jgi:hypothetical protein
VLAIKIAGARDIRNPERYMVQAERTKGARRIRFAGYGGTDARNGGGNRHQSPHQLTPADLAALEIGNKPLDVVQHELPSNSRRA